MTIVTVCDGCGRRIVDSYVELELVVDDQTRHYCPDPNAASIGCGRKMRSAIERAQKELSGGS